MPPAGANTNTNIRRLDTSVSAPLIVGMIHGLVGSASLLLLLIPIIPSFWLKLVYLLDFASARSSE
ncbi:MAG: hypothetical protein J2P21_01800 [Chloracidobacterium sp.]|nr:hypothetical protein [Chloracidobacterium sp.]